MKEKYKKITKSICKEEEISFKISYSALIAVLQLNSHNGAFNTEQKFMTVPCSSLN